MAATDTPGSSSEQEPREKLLRRALAEAEVRASRNREAALGQALADSEAELAKAAALRGEVEDLKRARETASSQAEEGARSRRELEARVRELERALSGVMSSASGRATSPLRRLKQSVRD